jgi:hypothetical protein
MKTLKLKQFTFVNDLTTTAELPNVFLKFFQVVCSKLKRYALGSWFMEDEEKKNFLRWLCSMLCLCHVFWYVFFFFFLPLLIAIAIAIAASSPN